MDLSGLIAKALTYGGKGANIQPLTITQNGTYTAPAGVDGYSPVYVSVPDRYDEGYNNGYQQGYNNGYTDGKEFYKNLYDHENGDLPPVTDDMGNVIENAFEVSNDDELSNYICATAFNSDGDSVNVVGFGGDTDFKIYREETVNEFSGKDEVAMKMILRNRITGNTGILNPHRVVIADKGASTIKVKITSVTFSYNYGRVIVIYKYIKPDGTEVGDTFDNAYASNVGGTSFVGTGTETGWIYS